MTKILKEGHICSITITYNPDEELIHQIKSLKNQVDQILIIDNGSNNINFLKEIEKKYDLKIIFNNKNLGIAAALNIGAKYAIEKGFEWILTFDQDSIPSEDMVKNMLISYHSLTEAEKEKVMGIFPEYVNRVFMNEEKIEHEDGYEYTLTGMTSGNLLKSCIFSKIGFFDEKLFIDYVDNEFFLRAGLYGYKFIICKSAILLHNLGNMSKIKFLNSNIICTNHSYTRRYYITRNRLYVYKKFIRYYPDYVLKDFKSLLKEIIKVLLFEKQKKLKVKMVILGIIDFLRGKFGKVY